MTTQDASARRPELDAIRTLVVIGLVFFHSALVFDTRDDYYVKNAETTQATTAVAGLAVVWAMPMLFLIAGLGACHSLRRRGAAGFTRERLLRLGLPLVVATVLLIPLPVWLRERAADPAYDQSYADFLPRFFDVRWEWSDAPFVLEGEYFETGHLWFVVLLLAFSLLLAGLALLAKGDVRPTLGALVRRRGAILLIPAVPLTLICAFVGLEESFAGWSRWAYLLFFLYGFGLAADERIRTAMRRDAVPAAMLGLALFLTGLPLFLLAGEAEDGDPFTDMTGLAIGGRALYGAAGWCLLVAILGLLDRRAARRAPRPADRSPGRGLRLYGYLAAGVLPLYVLHQPIVVAVAYGVVGWEAPMLLKYLVIAFGSLGLTIAAYELLVRRTRATRLLFGVREPSRETYTPSHRSGPKVVDSRGGDAAGQ
ncbi:acyltransferase [Streptomyces sp. NPDC046712]|uniref:acyltransferase family protein n=1 Tax=Streptomyces sp. NPDC046712 TaxID=3154802 RepID=UPI0033CBE4C1